MNRLHLILPLAILLGGCISKDYALSPHDFRGSGHAEIPHGGQNGENPAPSDDSKEFVAKDSAVYVCAVEVPDSYDWRRDTACGCVEARLVLFENYNEVLSLDCGPGTMISLDPDTHHIIDGHLYTEYSTKDRTILKRDGQEVLSFNGREYMKGILCCGDSLYTLGQNRSGDGFTFRLNGEPLLVKKEGMVCGGFNEKNYEGRGALFKTNSRIYFRYTLGGKTYAVIDGTEGKNDIASDGRGHPFGEFVGTVAKYADEDGNSVTFLYRDDGVIVGEDFHPNGGYYFFPVGGACLYNGLIYLGITPHTAGGKPVIWTPQWSRELDLNGFITAVAVYEKTTN